MSNFPPSSNYIIHFPTLVTRRMILEIGIKIIPVTVVEEYSEQSQKHFNVITKHLYKAGFMIGVVIRASFPSLCKIILKFSKLRE